MYVQVLEALNVDLQLTVMYVKQNEVRTAVLTVFTLTLLLTLPPFKGKHGHGPLQSRPAHGSRSSAPCTYRKIRLNTTRTIILTSHYKEEYPDSPIFAIKDVFQ